MNYKSYSKKFREAAKLAGKSEKYIDECLVYAERLLENDLPVIYNVYHFSALVGVTVNGLYAISNGTKHYYRKFYINKKSGGKRRIEEPLPTLKEIQRFILNNILCKRPCSLYSKAFVPGKGLTDNARFHRKQSVLLKMDLKDYFQSIHDSRVYEFFLTLGYSKELCVLFTKLCTLNHSLPQGAPTSPYLSNLVTVNLDDSIFELCNNLTPKLRYSRYADDITISGSDLPEGLIQEIIKIVKLNSLRVNYDKVHIVRNHKRQVVTGVVVNQKMQAVKEYRKKIRLELYYIKKYGMDDHLKRSSANNSCAQKHCEQLLGKIGFCLQVNKNDVEMQTYKEYLLELLPTVKNSTK